MTRRKIPQQLEMDPVEIVLQAMSQGMSLTKACKLPGAPSRMAFLTWVDQDRDGLRDRYARARRALHDKWAEDIQSVAEDEARDPQCRKVEIDAKRWLLSKLRPGEYGDRIAVTDPNGAALGTGMVEAFAAAVEAARRAVSEDEEGGGYLASSGDAKRTTGLLTGSQGQGDDGEEDGGA